MEKKEKIEKLRQFWASIMKEALFTNEEMNERVFVELIEIYSGPDRRYYNLDYILERIEFYSEVVNADPGVMFAILYSRVKFSQAIELKACILSSSNVARAAARKLGAERTFITYIENLIYQSVTHISLVEGLKMMDDLSIYSLTKNTDDFTSDLLKVRKQYCLTDDHIFKIKVRDFVKKVSEGEAVFKTEEFKIFENQAKENIKLLASF